MPDNAIYYQIAYGALIALFAGYAFSIRLRRRAIARKREQATGSR
jgi:hypothetical protein